MRTFTNLYAVWFVESVACDLWRIKINSRLNSKLTPRRYHEFQIAKYFWKGTPLFQSASPRPLSPCFSLPFPFPLSFFSGSHLFPLIPFHPQPPPPFPPRSAHVVNSPAGSGAGWQLEPRPQTFNNNNNNNNPIYKAPNALASSP